MRVLIVDDQTLAREALKLHLQMDKRITTVEEAASGVEALKLLRTESFDLCLLDLSMPEMDGVELLMQIQNFGITLPPTLVMSFYPVAMYATKILGLGGKGYISKSASMDEFLYAMDRVMTGGRYLPAAFMEKLVFDDNARNGQMPHERLSDRELQVMILLAKGIAPGEIAERLHLSEKTVSTYRGRIMQKMELRNNVQLATYAINHRLIG